MTPEELALLNKILVTDDMTPEGMIHFLPHTEMDLQSVEMDFYQPFEALH